MKELGAIDVPIVVLVDEVDRVEDDEIRSIAQLVRSVADFPGISYVLAYDPKRVIQALGGAEKDDTLRDERGRGRAYLEKIVQLQIPLPVTFDLHSAPRLRSTCRARP
jgi:predicted KAP-like P-loop ATPase